MRIKKILNNNAFITRNENHQEIIVIGKAIAYGKHFNDEIDENKIYKTFEPVSKGDRKLILDMINDIPVSFFQIAKRIVDKANQDSKIRLTDSVYIALTDHISSSVDRAKEGLFLTNQFLWEIRSYYPKEYDLGMWAIKLIEQECQVKLPEDEAGFIAIHIISGELGNRLDDFREVIKFIKKVTSIVTYQMSIDVDKESLDYNRFVTHLKFFWQYMMYKNEKKSIGDLSNDMLKIIKGKRIEAYECSLKIKEFIKQTYNYELNNEDLLYMTIHIARITENSEEN
ncbi:transcriptional antiterminator [Companilactobacillus paralimentarius DSM 13238 = JCM 10415]|uniref:Transcriptional antiterminator n=1 Tax=Companilactobacillus paralimentarius DSM 13238 = JCM 10415 TaxID=1122151 RepID=A0A0R1PFK8_9LACO|nr:PRD domain-containing protein [Companilactobacillus paralimentarius]KAE9565476.1 transcription antiterminator LicT [Companilactobacillus paralimentarius]KRL31006.1 transcriptional antiterminator [Companilactobacillus paralimentarius DSM 13238 = JCM 10415]MDR4933551.1 PRD domain-containing protein [Companilactobacillus paralimentarius]QFR70022.1 PRD domain-containing protein [Companilactobacillus paralimentarius]